MEVISMIYNDLTIEIDKIEAFYIIKKNYYDTYISIKTIDNKSILFTFKDNFNPHDMIINEKIDLVKYIYWDITLKTNDTFYLFDITKDKVFLTRLDDNKYRLEVSIKNPDMIYCPLGDNESFNNLSIDVTLSFTYE